MIYRNSFEMKYRKVCLEERDVNVAWKETIHKKFNIKGVAYVYLLSAHYIELQGQSSFTISVSELQKLYA